MKNLYLKAINLILKFEVSGNIDAKLANELIALTETHYFNKNRKEVRK